MNMHAALDAIVGQTMKVAAPFLDPERHDPYRCRKCGRVYPYEDIPTVESLPARGGHPDAAEPAEHEHGCPCGARESFDPVEGES